MYTEVLADFFVQEQFGTRRSVRLPGREESEVETGPDVTDRVGSVASNLRQPKYSLYQPVLLSSLEAKRNPLLSARSPRDLRRSPEADKERSLSPQPARAVAPAAVTQRSSVGAHPRTMQARQSGVATAAARVLGHRAIPGAMNKEMQLLYQAYGASVQPKKRSIVGFRYDYDSPVQSSLLLGQPRASVSVHASYAQNCLSQSKGLNTTLSG